MERSLSRKEKWLIVCLTIAASQVFNLTIPFIIMIADAALLVGAVCTYVSDRKQAETA